jgi:predicted polyphosphate/ATP-dependent NAD kinase
MGIFNKFILGLIINPISGMGGSVGLKGTDGREILLKAIKLGAKPSAFKRAKELLSELQELESKIKFLTCPGIMGEHILKQYNFEFSCVNHSKFNNVKNILDLKPEHTEIAAGIMKTTEEVKILLFVGGDGTARDIVKVVGKKKPCLGIPAGVKIFSSVFSLNPGMAASLIFQFLLNEIPLKESEVLDIDENKYRNGELDTRLYGTLLTPFNPDYIQRSKIGSPESDLSNQERIAKRVVELLKNDVYYLLGPGTTTKVITDNLKQPKTVLGVDLCLNNEIIAQDLNEDQILEYIEGRNAQIIVSPLGNQGFLFGRGNLQFTPKVLNKIGSKNIIIISTKYKLATISNQLLRLDTRDPELDKKLKGFYKVVVDYDEVRIIEVQ